MATGPTREPGAQPADPLRRDIRSPGTLLYLSCYLLLGSSVVIIILPQFVDGARVAWWLPVLGIVFALYVIQRQQAKERGSGGV